jgi:DNA-binding PadR family transcriptional regulator
MYKDLDPILHQQLRLSIVSILIGVKEADFNFIKEKCNATAGNLSVQLTKLGEAGYIEIQKSFRNKLPLTTCKITEKGIEAFDEYVSTLKDYLKLDNPGNNKT